MCSVVSMHAARSLVEDVVGGSPEHDRARLALLAAGELDHLAPQTRRHTRAYFDKGNQLLLLLLPLLLLLLLPAWRTAQVGAGVPVSPERQSTTKAPKT